MASQDDVLNLAYLIKTAWLAAVRQHLCKQHYMQNRYFPHLDLSWCSSVRTGKLGAASFIATYTCCWGDFAHDYLFPAQHLQVKLKPGIQL